MKKFKFPLDMVLIYKQQILDVFHGEHATILAQVRQQEETLQAIWVRYRAYNTEYRKRKYEGLPITEALIYQSGLRSLEDEIQKETQQLAELYKQEEKKREQVVEAKKETSSLEKLKEKKLDLYQKAIRKDEEAGIDEFVSAARVSNTTA